MSDILSLKVQEFIELAPRGELIKVKLTRPLYEPKKLFPRKRRRVRAWRVGGAIPRISNTVTRTHYLGGFHTTSINVWAGFTGVTPEGFYVFAYKSIEADTFYPDWIENEVWCGPDPERLVASVLKDTRLQNDPIGLYLNHFYQALDRKIKRYS